MVLRVSGCCDSHWRNARFCVSAASLTLSVESELCGSSGSGRIAQAGDDAPAAAMRNRATRVARRAFMVALPSVWCDFWDDDTVCRMGGGSDSGARSLQLIVVAE